MLFVNIKAYNDEKTRRKYTRIATRKIRRIIKIAIRKMRRGNNRVRFKIYLTKYNRYMDYEDIENKVFNEELEKAEEKYDFLDCGLWQGTQMEEHWLLRVRYYKDLQIIKKKVE